MTSTSSDRRPFVPGRAPNDQPLSLIDFNLVDSTPFHAREVVAFCYPCSLKVGNVIVNRLSVLDADVRAAYFSDWPEDEKEALSSEHLEWTGHYAYRGRGRVIDVAEGLVEVLGFVIEMGAMCEGHVEFEIDRLDISV